MLYLIDDLMKQSISGCIPVLCFILLKAKLLNFDSHAWQAFLTNITSYMVAL